jgi:hypothetical protein
MRTPIHLPRSFALFVSLVLALGVSSCSRPNGAWLLIENPTPVSTTAKVEGQPPAVGPLPCEALGVADRYGDFVPITYLSGILPRSAGQNIALNVSNCFKVYRGTNRIAAGNHFLGEYLVTDLPASPAGLHEVTLSFRISEKRELYMYARSNGGTSVLYTLRRVDTQAN